MKSVKVLRLRPSRPSSHQFRPRRPRVRAPLRRRSPDPAGWGRYAEGRPLAGLVGSCYLNNAAVAAQALRSVGAQRVAVIDIGAHHGNGAQMIF
jgi:hypothetical protein